MKSKFIKEFLNTVLKTAMTVDNFIKIESLDNKMLRIGGFNPDVIYKGFKNLEHRKILQIHNQSYRFTKKGLRWINGYKFKSLSINKNKWDGKWRVVIFDIPEDLRTKRNILRSKLKALGFRNLQKSIFVCPFPCESELGFLADYLDVNDYIDVLIAESIGFKEQGIKEFYNL